MIELKPLKSGFTTSEFAVSISAIVPSIIVTGLVASKLINADETESATQIVEAVVLVAVQIVAFLAARNYSNGRTKVKEAYYTQPVIETVVTEEDEGEILEEAAQTSAGAQG